MLLILALSSLPAQALPKNFLLSWDKLIHFVEYFILGILSTKSMKVINLNTLKAVLPLGVLFACCDEYLQSFISGRFSSSLDVLADSIGFLFGCWITPLLMGQIGHIRTFTVLASIGVIGCLLHPIIVDPYFWSFLRIFYQLIQVLV